MLDLVNADRLTGQPETTRAMLAEALAGRSPVDGAWWAELEAPATDVLHDADGQALGVVSYAVRPGDPAPARPTRRRPGDPLRRRRRPAR
ncbi:hypothetical protein ABZ725_36105 [Streptomyces sp. NPDC006872]|uniref:hypothetical protein n=1 Tax=Streptomyces sp. NPDC006872 TaxID=3155720 RepID=UPI0033F460FF